MIFETNQTTDRSTEPLLLIESGPRTSEGDPGVVIGSPFTPGLGYQAEHRHDGWCLEIACAAILAIALAPGQLKGKNK